MNDSRKSATAEAKGSHARCGSARVIRASVRWQTRNIAAVSKGIGASRNRFGSANHLSKIRLLTSGVATETAMMPTPVSHRLPRAQLTARVSNSPSVLRINQVAPSRE